jgi:hypothetical protein
MNPIMIYNNSLFINRFTEYTNELSNKMYCFEVTKCCGYSALVYVYKTSNVIDLYNNIYHHFRCNQIVELYLLNKDNTKISINDYLDKSMTEFIQVMTDTSNRILEPIYPLPLPVVYKLYLDDGHTHPEN